MKRTFYLLLTILASTAGTAYSQGFSWAKTMNGGSVDRAHVVSVDQQGNVYTAGIFTSTGDFDPGPGVITFSSAGNYDIFIQKLDPAGNLLWVKQIGGIMDDVPNGLDVDDEGNVYVSGSFSDQVDFDPGTETVQLITAGNYDAFVLKMDTDGNLDWAKKIGSTFGDFAHDLTTDPSGNVYVTGIFGGTVDFDPGAGTANLTSANNNFYESFLLKLNNSGDFAWVKQIGGSEDEYGRAVSTDASGNIYTLGYFYGTVDFDPGAGTDNHTSGGGSDIFVQKLTGSGDFVWAHTIGSTENEYCQGIDANASGAVYLFGTFGETVDFDPGAGTSSFTSVGQADMFLLKLNNDGDFTWARQIGSENQDFARALVTDASANVYLTGNIYDVIDLDPGTGTATFSTVAQGTSATFAEKIDASGNYEWAGIMAPSNGCYATDIAINSLDEVHLVGSFSGVADCDPGAGVSEITAFGNHDIYIVKWGGAVSGLSESWLPELTAWPNPTTGELTIDLGELNSVVEAEITDLSGALVGKETFYNTGEIKMNVAGRQGIYFVRVRTASGERIVKVVKN